MIHTPLKAVGLALLIFLSPAIHAQHYYHDIMGTRETNAQMERLIRAGVTSVSATGFNQDNRPEPGFSETQTIRPVAPQWTITRSQDENRSWEYLAFNSQNQLIRSVDSTTTTINRTYFRYDEAGRIVLLENSASDTAMGITEMEQHHWYYDPAGLPEKMVRVVNGRDTTEFRFVKDENGNVAEETTYKRGNPTETIYYYYNENGQLTDIVRYNTRAKRLLPDFMFEYDETGRVIQKITVMPNPKIGYLIWRYQYNEKGLKVREANFTREKKLIGRIDYSYVD